MKALFALPVALALLASPVLADEAAAKKNGCMACHAVAKKVVGPSFKDIAAKKSPADVLAKHVREGSKGVWGAVPMPAQAKISDDDLKKVIAWVQAQ